MKTNQMKYPILFLSIVLLSISCKTKHELQVTASPSEGGKVTPQTGEYEEGEEVTLQAAVNSDYKFIGWSGDWTGTDNPVTITMDKDYSIVANFELPIYRSETGTIVCQDWVAVGETYPFEGNFYTVVDEAELRQEILQQSNLPSSLNQYCTSKIKDMSRMFRSGRNWPDISEWDVSNVTNMGEMFGGTVGDISNWDVSNVTNMEYMFGGCNFNGDLSEWDVSNVTNMEYMFRYSPFNQDISNWDVSNVTNMEYMFFGAGNFNGDISSWDVSNVTNMERMFQGSPFNQDISSWDVSNVTNMEEMFGVQSSFNQDLSSWQVSQVTKCQYFGWPPSGYYLPKPNFTACNCECGT
jgi:surface protein